MHILPLLIAFAFTKVSLALPPLVFPSTTPSLNPLTLNASTLFRQPWPDVPWTYTIDESASISFEYYGRNVCSGDWHCKERVMENMNLIVEIVYQEYVMEPEKIDSFASEGVNFWIKQKATVPKILVMELVATLRWLMLRYGTREVTHARFLNHRRLAATFELTFPGIED